VVLAAPAVPEALEALLISSAVLLELPEVREVLGVLLGALLGVLPAVKLLAVLPLEERLPAQRQVLVLRPLLQPLLLRAQTPLQVQQ
jgi:hypothetical protein